jgi:hypothetical protein
MRVHPALPLALGLSAMGIPCLICRWALMAGARPQTVGETVDDDAHTGRVEETVLVVFLGGADHGLTPFPFSPRGRQITASAGTR